MKEFKKFNGTSWQTTQPKKYDLKEFSGTPPFNFESDGGVLQDWSIAGQTVQASTPTPSLPVAVNGVGEKTGNLFDATTVTNERITWATGATFSADDYRLSDYIPVETTQEYTCSTSVWFVGYDANKTYLGTYNDGAWDKNGLKSVTQFVNSATLGAAYVRLLKRTTSVSTIMLNTGSTALPYEPYGYKIPITCGGTTTNIYLGSATSTRKIKKLVLTGNETNWRKATNSSVFYRAANDYPAISGVICICTHYAAQGNVTSANNVANNCVTFAQQQFSRYYIRDDSISTLEDFQTYLQQQYAAGTPVTIWYVLATEDVETAVRNEPLMKIGDYADEINLTNSGVNISTVEGSNTLMVNTIIQPSSMSIKKGLWKTCSLYEYTPNISGVPPFTFKSDGENLRNWSMKGQTVQASTPTPSSPVNPSGCGEKTGNLICASQTGSSTSSGLTLTYTQGSSAVTLDKDTTSGATFGTVPVNVTLAAGTYAVSVQNLLVKVANTYDRIYLADSNNNVVVNYVMSDAPKSFTLAAETTISKISFVCDASSVYDSATITIMLNIGSTAQPFEPYGVKIPITCGGQTTNIYLDAQLMDGDTISLTSTGVNIPTVSGSNTLSVNTTVQPSGMTIQSISQWIKQN